VLALRVKLVAAAAVCVAVAALYYPSLHNPLVWDDTIHIDRARQQTLGQLAGRAEEQYRRPLVLLSYVAQIRAGLDSPAAFHAVNIAIHTSNALLVYTLALQLGVALPAAFAGAALFGVHPLQSAAVAYVSGRSDLLAAMFSLLALLALSAGRGGLKAALLVALCVAGAGLSKENGLVAGPIVLLLWYLRRGGYRSSQWPDQQRGAGGGERSDEQSRQPPGLRSAGWAPALAAVVAGACTAAVVAPPALYGGAGVGIGSRLEAAGSALGVYSRLLLWPTDLHMDRLSALSHGGYATALALALLAVVVAALARLALRPSSALFALAATALAYLPAAGFIPVYPAIADAWVYTPEQFLYLPLAAAAPLAAAVAHHYLAAALGPRPGAALMVLLVAAVLVASTPALRKRQSDFSNEEALYRQTLAHSPSPRACFNLGVSLIGRRAYDEAAELYLSCARISPHDAGVWGQLGYCYAQLGKGNQARLAYGRALELDPGDALSWSNSAALDANSGQYEDAREKWRKALELAPGLQSALRGLEQLEGLAEQPH